MPEITVSVDEEDKQFLEDNNIDPSELLGKQIRSERQRVRRENPTPDVQDELIAKLKQLIEDTRDSESKSRLGAFSDGVTRAPVSVSAHRRKDDSVQIRLKIVLDTLPSNEVGPTLRESQDFLMTLREGLEPAFEGVDEEVIFSLSDRSQPEHDLDRDTATFKTSFSV